MAWKCFLIEPTDEVAVELRRFVYRSQEKCPDHPYGYHTAKGEIARGHPDDLDLPSTSEITLLRELKPDHDRWPESCPGCGRPFEDDDEWQVNVRELYRPADGQELPEHIDPDDRWTLRDDDLPIGAMWDASWMSQKGPDGRSLFLRCPGEHDWYIDGRADNGPGWEREGEPPNITARPSIGIPASDGDGYFYHGWLTDGELSDPLPDSRMEP